MRVFLIVLDSFGIGNAPDAEKFGDFGANTFKSCFKTGILNLPNMTKLGLFNIDDIDFGEKCQNPVGNYARVLKIGAGKDTTVGHYEMTGVVLDKPFPTYPNGFPAEIIEKFEQKTGRKVLCNKPYSGSEVLKDYATKHLETGDLIVYTSADSVFQIAACEDIVPIDELYKYCKIAREILCDEHAVARVIARPFIVENDEYVRTKNRHDYSMPAPRDTLLDIISNEWFDVIGVGKISDIFSGRGLTKSFENKGNSENMKQVFELQKHDFNGLCFVNLVDFDMTFGHRRDVLGYANCLNEFDTQLGEFLENMCDGDQLIITADHGCDPCFKGTDHTRETVPYLEITKGSRYGKNLGIISTSANISANILAKFNIVNNLDGTQF